MVVIYLVFAALIAFYLLSLLIYPSCNKAMDLFLIFLGIIVSLVIGPLLFKPLVSFLKSLGTTLLWLMGILIICALPGPIIHAVNELPYDYYILLRFILCAAAVYMAHRAKLQKQSGWMWLLGAIAILVNPFKSLDLEDDTWKIISWICTAIIGLSVKFVYLTKRNMANMVPTYAQLTKSNSSMRAGQAEEETIAMDDPENWVNYTFSKNGPLGSAIDNVKKLVREAFDANQDGNYDKAIEKLEQAIEIETDASKKDQFLCTLLSITYNNYGLTVSDPEKAVEQLYKAALLNPNSKEILVNLNRAAERLNGSKLTPFANHLRLASKMNQLGEYFGAISACSQALKINDNESASVLFNEVMIKAKTDLRAHIYLPINRNPDIELSAATPDVSTVPGSEPSRQMMLS